MASSNSGRPTSPFRAPPAFVVRAPLPPPETVAESPGRRPPRPWFLDTHRQDASAVRTPAAGAAREPLFVCVVLTCAACRRRSVKMFHDRAIRASDTGEDLATEPAEDEQRTHSSGGWLSAGPLGAAPAPAPAAVPAPAGPSGGRFQTARAVHDQDMSIFAAQAAATGRVADPGSALAALHAAVGHRPSWSKQ